MALRAVGYFASQPGDRRPDVRTQVDSFWEQARRPRIVIYLRAGAVFEPSTVMGRCQLCPEPIGTRDLTDGQWLWPEGLSHYVDKHAVRVPDEMVAHMATLHFRVPKVDIRMLKMAATGMLDRPRELAALPPQTSPTTLERPVKHTPAAPKPAASQQPSAFARVSPTRPPTRPVSDLDDSTVALPLGTAWLAHISGVATTRPLVPFSGPVVLGRDESGADILVGHGSVSRRHCRLIPGAGAVIVQDLDSQNGVVVRGKKVSQAELREGESFHVGPATITLKRSPP